MLSAAEFYFAAVNAAAAAFALYDKIAAKKLPGRRVPENCLFALAAAGGAAGMLLCMLIVRHKTSKKKFMVGLPMILVLQIAAMTYLKTAL